MKLGKIKMSTPILLLVTHGAIGAAGFIWCETFGQFITAAQYH